MTRLYRYCGFRSCPTLSICCKHDGHDGNHDFVGEKSAVGQQVSKSLRLDYLLEGRRG